MNKKIYYTLTCRYDSDTLEYIKFLKSKKINISHVIRVAIKNEAEQLRQNKPKRRVLYIT